MDLSVHVSSVRGSQMAAKISGTFTIKDNTFRFSAIAFGRIGGQNIGASISKETQKRLGQLGYEENDVIMALQRKLLQGELSIPENIKKEYFADG